MLGELIYEGVRKSKAANTLFKDLRKYHYNVLKQHIDRDAIEALQGRTEDVTAQHYVSTNWIYLRRVQKGMETIRSKFLMAIC